VDFDCAETKKRFTDFCKKNKITQVKLAEAVGLTQGSVCRWFDVKSDTMPTFQALYWLVANFRLDLEWLITGAKKAETEPLDNSLTEIIKELLENNKKIAENLLNKLLKD